MPLPLSDWADRQLSRIAVVAGEASVLGLSGAVLLGERAALNGFQQGDMVSAGGGCRLYPCRSGAMALNLSRPDDRALLPALFGDAGIDPDDDAALFHRFLNCDPATELQQGRALGLAIAYSEEGPPATPAIERHHPSAAAQPKTTQPLVIDLSALWAGPLAGHLLWRSGARVIKVESIHRPDALRDGDPALFALLNQGKDSVQIDLRSAAGVAALRNLLLSADVVIEAARPRALLQLGIDAGAIVAANPARIWLSITGHGGSGDAANWVGFGDDCGVAGGLTAALFSATGRTAFVGDAIADPLTGITAALTAFTALQAGEGGRYFLSMRAIVAQAMVDERIENGPRFAAQLSAWSPDTAYSSDIRQPTHSVAPLGSDTTRILQSIINNRVDQSP